MKFDFYYYLLQDIHEIYLLVSVFLRPRTKHFFIIFLIRCWIYNFSCILIKFLTYMQKSFFWKRLALIVGKIY